MDAIEVLIPLTLFSIPIVAIISNTFIRYQKLKHGVGPGITTKDMEEIRMLKERIHNLEVIVSDSANTPQLEQLSKEELQAQIDTLSYEVRQLKSNN